MIIGRRAKRLAPSGARAGQRCDVGVADVRGVPARAAAATTSEELGWPE
jgi:hypothetical protein